jgi:DNA polymerase-1
MKSIAGLDVILDIEANGFLLDVTEVWIIVLRELKTNEVVRVYYPYRGDRPWEELNSCRMLVGHNILGYDLPVLKKLFGFICTTHVVDTMLMSQVLDYKRFGFQGHSMEIWGKYFGFLKGEFDKFHEYSPEMESYCIRDTELNRLIYRSLLEEFKKLSADKPLLKESLKIEHDTSRFVSQAYLRGWLFDKNNAVTLLADLEAEIQRIETLIKPNLKTKIKAKDKEPKKAKWKKDGTYNNHTSSWFGIDPSLGKAEIPPICGEFTRIEFIEPDVGSMDDIKEWLYRIGWKPDDWNWKRINGVPTKVSPKLSTSSLEKLGNNGMLVDELTTLRSRHSILKGWLNELDNDSRLHGSCFTIGTPTGRATHSTIVNIPSVKSKFGKEIRSLFVATPGYKIIGADSSGNQFRALCHYIRDESFTQIILNGDIHQANADILSKILGKKIDREDAKTFIYAFLFGAGTEKVGLILTGIRNKKIGKKVKDEFIKQVPGLEAMTDKIKEVYYDTQMSYGEAFIEAADGRRIYCDSPHKALNYLLQSFEAISCKAAISYFMKKADEIGLHYHPLVWYHDEIEFEVLEKDAEVAQKLAIEAFIEGGKIFNMMILNGSGKVGNNWCEVH